MLARARHYIGKLLQGRTLRSRNRKEAGYALLELIVVKGIQTPFGPTGKAVSASAGGAAFKGG
jgi:hypothetical protein